MDKKNVWTVIRGSGRPWHDPKWSSARDVLDAVEEENSHGGSSHDFAWQLMHNGKIIVSEGLSTMAYRSMEFKRWVAKIVYHVDATVLKTVYHYVDELEELQDLVEKGPPFGAIKSFEISYTGFKTTIEESNNDHTV